MRKFLLLAGLFSVVLMGCMKENANVVLQSIAIKPDTLTITAGNTLQLTPTFSPAVFSTIPVVWSSDNNNVASVSSDGLLLATKSGTTWVYIKDKNSATGGKCLVVVQ